MSLDDMFTEQEQWILPTMGTLGNKAKNLFENTPIIEESGFKVPRSIAPRRETFPCIPACTIPKLQNPRLKRKCKQKCIYYILLAVWVQFFHNPL